MLVRDVGTVSTAQAIYTPAKPEALGLEIERMPLAFFVASDLDVKSPPCINPRIREPDHFDVFEIEQTLAISERVK